MSFDDVKTAVKFAFYEWSNNSKLTFVEHSFPDWTSINFCLSFQSKDHGETNFRRVKDIFRAWNGDPFFFMLLTASKLVPLGFTSATRLHTQRLEIIQ